MDIKHLVIATTNPGKLREISTCLAPLNCQIDDLSTHNLSQCDEPYLTFVENALAKARHCSEATGLPALADDSGLCIPGLGDKPGVRSARFAEDDSNFNPQADIDLQNNQKVLKLMQDISQRQAYYLAVMVLIQHQADPRPLIVQATWEGVITHQMIGTNGFGYDPIFCDPTFGKTGAQLSLTEKNRVSHRGQSLRLLCQQIKSH